MYYQGWISLDRSIQSHWIFEDDRYFKWWVVLLMNVNHSDSKMNLGSQLYLLKRGQSGKSLRTWGNIFNTSTKSVTKFFDLLESDGMITRTTIGNNRKQSTTLINIENYDKYQDNRKQEGNVKETREKQERNVKGTQSNNDNNLNNGNNKNNESEKARAYKILLENKKSELEAFAMQNPKIFKNESELKNLVDRFDDKMEIEISQGKIEFVPEQLMPRFRSYASQWILNLNDAGNKNNSNDPNLGKNERF